MITVQILDERHDVHAERVDQSADLLGLPGARQKVDHLLHRARAVHVERDRDEVIRDRVDNRIALLLAREFQ